MLPALKLLDVTQVNGDMLQLQWEFYPTWEDLSPYELKVWRSESTGNFPQDWDVIASGLSFADGEYLDTSLSGLYSFNRTWAYHLEILKDGIQQEIYPELGEPAIKKITPPDKEYKWILKQKKKSLKFIGRDLKLYKKRTWGQKCSTGWDEILQKPTGKKCDGCTCFSTGWINGYFTPIEFRGMITANPKITQITLFGEFMPSDVILSLPPYPQLSPADMIVDDVGKRWWVQQVRPIEKKGVLLEQIAQLSLIHPDDELYKI